MQSENKFVLRVPLDASRVRGFARDLPVKVLAWSSQGATQQQMVRFDERGKGVATFAFDERPQGALRVAAGPDNATPFELKRMQTLSIRVPASAWADTNEVAAAPIQITAYYAWWWQHWKQSFKITGQVLSPRGVPIAGAAVSAFDIDAWWWWTAEEPAGEAVTDRDGAFALEFTRGSGWWPWWWWATREWKADAELVGRITAFVGQYARFGSLAGPTAAPSLGVFESLLATSPRRMPQGLSIDGTGNGAMDPAMLEGLRERLVEILPRNFALPVWPWKAWAPWEDCGANLIFRVNDNCGDETTVLLQESVSEARWEIPSVLDVTLTTREANAAEKGGAWTLVDYLFAGRPPAWNEPAGGEAGSGLARTA